jgi:hypothetical protein
MTNTPRLAFVLLSALLLPACGDDTPTDSTVPRAAIGISVDPAPVPPAQNTLTGTVSIGYRVTITELNGLGGELQFVASQVFDPETGLLANLSYFDGADLVVFVGKKRLDPGGSLVVPQTMSYLLPDFRTKATLTINVQLKDDHDNVINQSVLVKVE